MIKMPWRHIGPSLPFSMLFHFWKWCNSSIYWSNVGQHWRRSKNWLKLKFSYALIVSRTLHIWAYHVSELVYVRGCHILFQINLVNIFIHKLYPTRHIGETNPTMIIQHVRFFMSTLQTITNTWECRNALARFYYPTLM
jgi:hypothetical protein